MTTPQDVERLSAYLDHQLSLAERARLEARLKQEPELRAALTDLQATVHLLRGLPTLKPPRNFTLSAKQAAKLPQRRPIFMRLRLATAVAMLALTSMVGGDLLASLTLRATAPMPEAQVAAEKTEPMAGGAGGASLTQDSFAATEELMMADATLSTPLPYEVETNAPDAELPAPMATEASTDQRNSSSTFALTETSSAIPTSTPVAVAESITVAPPEEVPAETAPTVPALPPSPWPFVRFAEVGLGLLVVLLATAAWLTRK